MSMGPEREHCRVTTGPLNCGCCGDVELNCDLPAEPAHNAHEMTPDTSLRERVRWYFIFPANTGETKQ